MCGVIGISGSAPIVDDLINGLSILQHRGQDAAGIGLDVGGNLHVRKGMGMVRDVFGEEDAILQVDSRIGIGHVRYPTWGSTGESEAQPLTTSVPYGISMAHNGQLVNAEQVRRWITDECHRYLTTDSDSELLLNSFAHYLNKCDIAASHISFEDIYQSVLSTMERCRGAYAVTAMILNGGLVGFRDPLGIRPLVLGSRVHNGKSEYMLASESSVLSVMGFKTQRDVAPGEIMFIDRDGQLHTKVTPLATGERRHCVFEYIYMSRPDSQIDGISVYEVRRHMGRELGKDILKRWQPLNIDSVIPIPECSNTAAAGVAEVLDLPYREAFVKNRYSGRTFIIPKSERRHQVIRRKYNPIPQEIEGKNILLVDDSIVRGSTAKRLVGLARDQGAKKIYFASAAPPVKYQNIFGIDVPTRTELIAFQKEEDEIAQYLGVDGLIYLSVEAMLHAVRQCTSRPNMNFDLSMFDGDYHFPEIDEAVLSKYELIRADGAMVETPTAKTLQV